MIITKKMEWENLAIIEAKKRIYSTIKHFDVEDGEYGV